VRQLDFVRQVGCGGKSHRSPPGRNHKVLAGEPRALSLPPGPPPHHMVRRSAARGGVHVWRKAPARYGVCPSSTDKRRGVGCRVGSCVPVGPGAFSEATGLGQRRRLRFLGAMPARTAPPVGTARSVATARSLGLRGVRWVYDAAVGLRRSRDWRAFRRCAEPGSNAGVHAHRASPAELWPDHEGFTGAKPVLVFVDSRLIPER
jgi:hypothetical protein